MYCFFYKYAVQLFIKCRVVNEVFYRTLLTQLDCLIRTNAIPYNTGMFKYLPIALEQNGKYNKFSNFHTCRITCFWVVFIFTTVAILVI